MDQKTALNILKTGRNVFLTGAPGSGKTYVLNKYIDYLKSKKIPTAKTASTGAASVFLGGQTIHSFCGLKTKETLTAWDLEAILEKEYLYKKIHKTKVLIIDEVSMISSSLLDSVDLVLKAVKGNSKPFGGVQIVLSGDFFQLPPVVKGGGDFSFAFEALSWKNADIRTCYLSTQHRQKNDKLYEILSEMRSGNLQESTKLELKSRVGVKPKEGNTTFLFTHNSDVDRYNKEKLMNLKGRVVKLKAKTEGSKKHAQFLLKNILAPEELTLKVGALVMFVKNDPEGRYVNGSLGEIVGFSGNLPRVKLQNGRELLAETVSWSYEEDGKIKAQVHQVPLRLAWAITVHKSQGMTLDSVYADLSKVFVEGQGYVALSRAKSLDRLYLAGLTDKAFLMHKKVLDFDIQAKKESDKWNKIINNFSKAKLQTLHEEFAGKTASGVKLATDEKTLSLLKEGLTVEEIAEKRGITLSTVLSHLEKNTDKLVFENLLSLQSLLSGDDYNKIKKVAESLSWEKLSPLKAKLPRYSYDQIKFARILYFIRPVPK